MKKIITFALCVSMVLSSTTSCNNQEELNNADFTEQTQQTVALEQLNSEFAQFNQQKKIEGGGVETRSLKSFFRKFFCVIGADLLGAGTTLWGGPAAMVAGAAASSSWAICKVRKGSLDLDVKNHPYTQGISIGDGTDNGGGGGIGNPGGGFNKPITKRDNNLGGLIPNKPNLTFADSVGYFHNKVILELENENPGWTTLDKTKLSKELAAIVDKCVGATTDSKVTDADVKQAADKADAIANIVAEANDVDELMDAMIAKYPNQKAKMNVFREVLKGFEQCKEMDQDGLGYAEDLLEILNKYNLDEKTMNQIVSAIVVANASSKLWNPDYVPENK